MNVGDDDHEDRGGPFPTTPEIHPSDSHESSRSRAAAYRGNFDHLAKKNHCLELPGLGVPVYVSTHAEGETRRRPESRGSER